MDSGAMHLLDKFADRKQLKLKARWTVPKCTYCLVVFSDSVLLLVHYMGIEVRPLRILVGLSCSLHICSFGYGGVESPAQTPVYPFSMGLCWLILVEMEQSQPLLKIANSTVCAVEPLHVRCALLWSSVLIHIQRCRLPLCISEHDSSVR